MLFSERDTATAAKTFLWLIIVGPVRNTVRYFSHSILFFCTPGSYDIHVPEDRYQATAGLDSHTYKQMETWKVCDRGERK